MSGTKSAKPLVVPSVFAVVSSPSLAMAAGRVAPIVGTSTTPTSDGCRTRRRKRPTCRVQRRLRFVITTDVNRDRLELTDPLRTLARRSAVLVDGVEFAGVRCSDEQQ